MTRSGTQPSPVSGQPGRVGRDEAACRSLARTRELAQTGKVLGRRHGC
jgi:hypothetical protein